MTWTVNQVAVSHPFDEFVGVIFPMVRPGAVDPHVENRAALTVEISTGLLKATVKFTVVSQLIRSQV